MTIEANREFFEGFSGAMICAYIYQELGADSLRGFLNMLTNPTDEQIVEICTPHLGTVTAYDIKCARETVYPLEEYAAELREMGLERVADIVSPRSSDDGVTSPPPPD